MQIWVVSTSRACADNTLYAVEVKELESINSDGRNTHAVTHNRYLLALVCACVAVHAAHLIYELRVFEITLCHKFCTQWIACHNNFLGNFAVCCADVRCRCHK